MPTILPTKHVHVAASLLGVGGTVLRHLDRPKTVTDLWEGVRGAEGTGSFSRFAIALDLLYALGLVEFHDGVLRRTAR